MPDHEKPNARGLFGGVFARGGVEADDAAWLQAMLDAEAGLARALERAGWRRPGRARRSPRRPGPEILIRTSWVDSPR